VELELGWLAITVERAILQEQNAFFIQGCRQAAMVIVLALLRRFRPFRVPLEIPLTRSTAYEKRGCQAAGEFSW
jgi:hypothetical protein